MNTRFRKYNNLMNELQEEQRVGQRLQQINTFFNKFRYKREITDYWKCRPEFLDDGYGDCDDFAISKYFSLLKLNINWDKLKIAYANIIINDIKEAHMVILYQHSKKLTLILDNYDLKIHRLDNRKNLEIVFTFNNKFLYFKGVEYENHMEKWIAVEKREQENIIRINDNQQEELLPPSQGPRQNKDNTRLSPDI